MTTRRPIQIVAAALAALALGAPTAFAMPDRPISPVATQSAGERLASTPETITVPGPTVVVEADESSGFEWGSAAIGAAIAAGILLLGAAAATSVTRHHRLGAAGPTAH
jgi:hypothetical protein